MRVFRDYFLGVDLRLLAVGHVLRLLDGGQDRERLG